MGRQSFDDWLGSAWDEHETDADAVAGRLGEGLALVRSEAQLVQLSHLAQHLHGEHLGRWDEGRGWQQALASHSLFGNDIAVAVRWRSAALATAGGDAGAAYALGAAERIRARALAASALAERDTPRATALFSAALAEADAQADTAPIARAVAITANNLAAALEEKARLSADERALMLQAAHAARRWWALAGGWLETERAEYRLALSHLKAGDAAQARRHAALCLEIVQANAAPPLEHFFGWQAMALAAQALADVDGHAKALMQARQAFDALDDADKAWCRESLDKLHFGHG